MFSRRNPRSINGEFSITTPTMKQHPLRVGARLASFCAVAAAALLDYLFNVWLLGRSRSVGTRARWSQRWGAQFLRVLHVRVTAQGAPPTGGLIVCNHLSYLDIPVLAAQHPLVFVSKSEVRNWPIIGWLTRCAGTLFINREQKSDVARLAAEFAPVVAQGVAVVLFPEGTSSDGAAVLPFRSSLLAPASDQGWAVTPAWIGYTLTDGSVGDEVCYWRDMTFASHFLNLLSKGEIQACIAFGLPIAAGPDRKELARQLHAQVCELRERYGVPHLPPPDATSVKPTALLTP